ncbi:MAG: LysR family transcriptional regulator [Oscillospiraceae bacterium]|nr:LysR family transcriptional regulator [Oscillospiraceae bacterium]
MDLRTLRYFAVTAEELNITHAAERLSISQPPLSNQIKALEEELGVTLFIRGKRRLKLTEAGSLLYRRAVQLLELAERTKEEISSLEGLSGTVSIALVEGRAPFLLARWISGFHAEFPQVKYRLWNGSGDDVLDRLRHGLADLAVVAAPFDSENLESINVGREPWVALFSKDNPLAQEPGDFIDLRKLVGKPLIVPSRASRISAIRSWFAELDAEPDILCEMSNYLDAEALAEQDVGVCIFPQTTYNQSDLVVSKVITNTQRQVEYALVWNKHQHNSELTVEFVNYVQDCLDEEKSKRQKYIVPAHEYLPPEDTKLL